MSCSHGRVFKATNMMDTSRRLFLTGFLGTASSACFGQGVATGWACGVCVGDYNNDGFEDLLVTYWGHNVLYRNNGDGTFSDVTQSAGLVGSTHRWGSGCTFVDYNRDGHLDLFVSNYLEFDLEKSPI